MKSWGVLLLTGLALVGFSGCGPRGTKKSGAQPGATQAMKTESSDFSIEVASSPGAGVFNFIPYGGANPITWAAKNIDWYYNGTNEPAALKGVAKGVIVDAQNKWSQFCNVRWTNHLPDTTLEATVGSSTPRPANNPPSIISWGNTPTNPDTGNPYSGYTSLKAKDGSALWADTTFNPARIGDRDTLVAMAKHEMGHALGLDHSQNEDSIMYVPYHSIAFMGKLKPDDVVGCQALYGMPATVPPPLSYFSINDNSNITVAPGQPVKFFWSSTNVVSITSVIETISNGNDACGNKAGDPWIATTASSMGRIVPNAFSGTVNTKFENCSAGHTYTYKITVRGQDGSVVDVKNSVTVSGAAQTPAAGAPTGYLDEVRASEFKVIGWAYDPDTSSQGLFVHVYIDGTYAGAAFTSVSRPDVNAARGITGSHGFEFTIPTAFRTGAHTLRVYAIDSSGAGVNPEISRSPWPYNFATAPAATASFSFLLNGRVIAPTGTTIGADGVPTTTVSGGQVFAKDAFGLRYDSSGAVTCHLSAAKNYILWYEADPGSSYLWRQPGAVTSTWREDVNTPATRLEPSFYMWNVDCKNAAGNVVARARADIRITSDCGPNWAGMQTLSCSSGVQYGTVCGCVPVGADPTNTNTTYWIHQDSLLWGCYKHMTGSGC